uniref:F-box protein At3g26010-like beta-propeller domain-containing protein n=1 Tax=Setaria italica TaxID=4555 RepID=K4A2N2_SETIT
MVRKPGVKGDGGLPLVDSELCFLPASSGGEVMRLDSCNGLLLLHCSSPTGGAGADTNAPPLQTIYVVCNPATGDTKVCSATLSFDPSVSSHFHVFHLEEKEQSYDHFIKAVEIYSSETETWVRKETRWSTRPHQCLFLTCHMTYLNGFLHLTTWDDVIAMVDARGEAWRTINVPCNRSRGSGFISHSQRRLVYVHVRTRRASAGELVIYVLEDHSSERWTRKHKVSNAFLFGPGKLPSSRLDEVFLHDRSGKRLVCYDMKQRRVNAIRTLEDVA